MYYHSIIASSYDGKLVQHSQANTDGIEPKSLGRSQKLPTLGVRVKLAIIIITIIIIVET